VGLTATVPATPANAAGNWGGNLDLRSTYKSPPRTATVKLNKNVKQVRKGDSSTYRLYDKFALYPELCKYGVIHKFTAYTALHGDFLRFTP